ncbi:MAG: zinc-binding dehydrogenase, partial [Gluconacetobacter diazotrophicus]|nr:zinc-binding dehydrogenase [Gluconacetobacter diazotrophicus]
MKAAWIDRYGGPEVLQVREEVRPVPGAGEVLVRIRHAGLNVMDVKTREGDYDGSAVYGIRLPTRVGMEGAGIVEAVGEGVSEPGIGDRVAYCLVWNSHAEFAVVPAAKVMRVPDALDLRIAGTSTFQGLTAHYLANDVGRLRAGMSCLVHAATGGVGRMLVSIAHRLGVAVYATVRREAGAEPVRQLGAAGVFPAADGAFVDPVLEATGGAGVDVVFDAIGAPTLRHDLRVVRTRGLVASYGQSGGRVGDLDPAELGERGSLFLTRPRLQDYLGEGAALRARANDLYRQMVDGGFHVPLGRSYSLDRIA